MSIDMLKALTSMSPHIDNVKGPELIGQVADDKTSLVLAGLHACGDLSVTMLKWVPFSFVNLSLSILQVIENVLSMLNILGKATNTCICIEDLEH